MKDWLLLHTQGEVQVLTRERAACVDQPARYVAGRDVVAD